MTLQEAVQSGRKFKRPFEESYWTLVEKDGLQWIGYADGKMEPLSVEWLLATDWELEPAEVRTFTKNQIIEAISAEVKERLSEHKLTISSLPGVPDLLLESIYPIIKRLGYK